MSKKGKSIQPWAVQSVAGLFFPDEDADATDTGSTPLTDADCKEFCDLLSVLDYSLLGPIYDRIDTLDQDLIRQSPWYDTMMSFRRSNSTVATSDAVESKHAGHKRKASSELESAH